MPSELFSSVPIPRLYHKMEHDVESYEGSFVEDLIALPVVKIFEVFCVMVFFVVALLVVVYEMVCVMVILFSS